MRHEPHCCVYRKSRVTIAKNDLAKAARRAIRYEAPSTLAAVKKARADVEAAQEALTTHLAGCDAADAPKEAHRG